MNIIYLLIAIVLMMAIMRMGGKAPVRAQADAEQSSIQGLDISATAF